MAQLNPPQSGLRWIARPNPDRPRPPPSSGALKRKLGQREKRGRWATDMRLKLMLQTKRKHPRMPARICQKTIREQPSIQSRSESFSPYLHRNENFVLVWPACGEAGALRTLENARRSARSTSFAVQPVLLAFPEIDAFVCQ